MSRKLFVIALTTALVAGMVVAPAEAAKKRKAVATTIYLHGNEPIGELESFTLVADGYLPMSTEKPAGDNKSKQLTNYVVGPNTTCAGNTLFPVWVGEYVGKVSGDIKVSFPVISTPGASVEVRIWPDINSLLCDSAVSMDYVPPAASATVALPAGQGTVEVTLPNAEFVAKGTLMLQISPELVPPFFGRVFYDVEDARIDLRCIPTSGKRCT